MGNKLGKGSAAKDDAATKLRAEFLSKKDALLAAQEHPPTLPGNEHMQLQLVPHQHTLFCERKNRVCTATGKLVELEALQLCGEESFPLESIAWIKTLAASSSSAGSCEAISTGLERTYRLRAEDVGYTISAHLQWVGDEGARFSRTIECGLGPVLPGPARLLDLHIEGVPSPGHTLVAVSEYIGGKEGASEYWWLRVRGGRREQLGEPQAAVMGEGDPRFLLLSEDDEGCVFKVKCLPVRSDGYRGEIVTSKASAVVEGVGRRWSAEVSGLAAALVEGALREASDEVAREQEQALRLHVPMLPSIVDETAEHLLCEEVGEEQLTVVVAAAREILPPELGVACAEAPQEHAAPAGKGEEESSREVEAALEAVVDAACALSGPGGGI